jgi:hypothetical protein
MESGISHAEVNAVKAVIAKLPLDAQRRIDFVAGELREVIAHDIPTNGAMEVELACTLVLAELAAQSSQ